MRRIVNLKNIIVKIEEARKLCLTAGRKPIAIAMTSQIYNGLFDELITQMRPEAVAEIKAVATIFEMKILKCEGIKDFLILDDKHWYEQKF